jgi:hypothetical protein
MFNEIFRKTCRLWDSVEKYRRAGKNTGDNMAHVHCMLATNTPKISNTYCFSTATMVPRTCLNVTLYPHCLFCNTYVFRIYLFMQSLGDIDLLIELIEWLIRYFVFLLLSSFFALFTYLSINPLFIYVYIHLAIISFAYNLRKFLLLIWLTSLRY